MRSPRSVATGVSFLLVGGVLAVVGTRKLLEPNEFRSVTSVQVAGPAATYSGPYFLLTEFQTIQSHLVLGDVAASLNLNERWGEKYNRGRRLSDAETEERIKTHLELRPVQNTRFIEIIAYDDDAEEAARLANAIARRYREYREEESRRRAAEVEHGMIVNRTVTVMDVAIPEFKPVRPNRYLAGAVLGCGIFLIIVGIFGLSDREVALVE